MTDHERARLRDEVDVRDSFHARWMQIVKGGDDLAAEMEWPTTCAVIYDQWQRKMTRINDHFEEVYLGRPISGRLLKGEQRREDETDG